MQQPPMPTQQGPSIVSDQTVRDLGQSFGNVAGKGIYITFRWVEIRLETTNEEKNGQRVRRLQIHKQPIGDPSTAATSYIKPEVAAQLYPAEWEYFHKHGDMPATGTPLTELPGISVSQIQIMNLAGLRSVEDVINTPMELIDRIGIEGQNVRTVADNWMKKAEDDAELIDYAEQITQMQNANAVERRRAESAEAKMAQMQAQLDAMQKLLPTATQGSVMDPVAPHVDDTPSIDDAPNALDDGDGDFDPLSD